MSFICSWVSSNFFSSIPTLCRYFLNPSKVIYVCWYWYFIVIFIFSKRLSLSLYSVVGKVHHNIVNVLEVVLFGGSSNVSISEPITFEDSVDGRQQNKATNIKFSIFYSELTNNFTENNFRGTFEKLLSFSQRIPCSLIVAPVFPSLFLSYPSKPLFHALYLSFTLAYKSIYSHLISIIIFIFTFLSI